MLSLPFFRYVFTCRWWILLLALTTIVLLTSLGFWQLHRFEEKKQMIDLYHQTSKSPEILLQNNTLNPKQYQKIRIKGTVMDDVFLLDNQHHAHTFGYHVISPVLVDGRILLVDRGFIAGDISRRTFPDIKAINQPVEWQGYVWYPTTGGLLLGQAIEKISSKKYLIEQPLIKYFEEILQKKPYPFIMRQKSQSSDGFLQVWPIVSMPPERHKAYALQWFAMALTVFLLLLTLNIKKRY